MLAAWYLGVEWPRREPLGYHYVGASFMLGSCWDLFCFCCSVAVVPSLRTLLTRSVDLVQSFPDCHLCHPAKSLLAGRLHNLVDQLIQQLLPHRLTRCASHSPRPLQAPRTLDPCTPAMVAKRMGDFERAAKRLYRACLLSPCALSFVVRVIVMETVVAALASCTRGALGSGT